MQMMLCWGQPQSPVEETWKPGGSLYFTWGRHPGGASLMFEGYTISRFGMIMATTRPSVTGSCRGALASLS